MVAHNLVASVLAVAPAIVAAAVCTTHTIPVTASANNQVVFAPTTDLTSPSGVLSFLGSGAGLLGQLTAFLPVSGTYNITAKYCQPARNPRAPAGRASEVQVLLHGVPYNSSYWLGLPGNPDGTTKYDWVEYATQQGYPVLAIDNLGAGDSQKANPITEVQQPLQTAILHQIVQQLRAGKLNFATKASKVIFVGHSLASVIGNAIATKYPADFDALILTGYSYNLVQAGLGLLLTLVTPAQLQNPAKFGSFPPGYLAFASRQGKRDAYYADEGSFSPALEQWDFEHEDTITVGQIVSAFSGLQRADNYRGDVLALTGQEDAFFCGPTGSRALGPQSCGSGDQSVPAKSKTFFPNAKFEYYLAPNTSHATTLHFSAPDSIRTAHQFLARRGY
ncbi:Putative alpha/beta hydrolase-1 [Septoria linicola]|uniref:Alpha/beta hydrolase-1 n=1 Tax=Septoria linicola TaxID=215465 RepID=A0A9Q9EMY9_9PEZI|nr:Putative alpha/beta hydrolase-1 [Septoria linicola]